MTREEIEEALLESPHDTELLAALEAVLGGDETERRN